MRYLGAIFIMCGCIVLSYFYERSEKSKLQNLIKIKDFISYAKSRIDLFLTPRDKLFSEYDDEFIKAVAYSESKDLIAYFDKRDCAIISDFLNSFGKGMKEEQLSLCEYTLLKLSASIEKNEAELKNKIKVFRTLAIFGGASLVILII